MWIRGSVVVVLLSLAGASSASGSAATGGIPVPAGAGLWALGGDYGEQIGVGLAAPGDVDGDGKKDLLVGAEIARVAGADPAVQTGAAYVLKGGLGGTIGVTAGVLPQAQGFGIVASGGTTIDGGSVAALGDVNGDGRPDMGMIGTAGGATRAWVVYGRAGAQPTQSIVASSPVTDGYTIDGPITAIDAAGDVNADGVGDLTLATPTKAFVLYGRAGRTAVTLGDTIAQEEGFTITGAAPRVVSAAGDVNQDGRADVVIGSTETRRAYVVYGPLTPVDTLAVADDMPLLRGFAIVPEWGGHTFDRDVADVGDVNGDGIADVAVASQGSGSGDVFVVYGRTSGGTVLIDVNNAAPTWAGYFHTSVYGPSLSVDRAGDLDHDGKGDLIIAAPKHSGERGWVHVARGSKPGSLPQPDTATGRIDPAWGYTITGVPVNAYPSLGATAVALGDGKIAVGEPQGGGGLAGAVYVVPGSMKSRTTLSRIRALKLAARLRASTFSPKAADGSGGTKLAVQTDVAAAVKATLYKVGSGRTCSALPFPGARANVCLPAVQRVARFQASGRLSGLRTVAFSGRTNGRKLPAGNYLVALQAVASGRISALRTLRFTIR